MKKTFGSVKFFTTGQIGRICGVSIATVQKWLDTEEVDHFRLPLTGSERRVPKAALIDFMEKYNIPVPEPDEEI